MKIEAVTVCVDYGDFLAHALPWNKPLFDRWIIVTSPNDRRTRDICEHHNVECVTTDGFYADDRAFAKAAGINAGLAALACDDWILHVDADIVLPPRARLLIERAGLDRQSIYGVDRLLCPSFAAWSEYVAWPEVQHSCETFIQASHFPLSPRVGHLGSGGDGWCPIGFFQLWNAASGRLAYPDHGNGDRSDMLFARQWRRAYRHLIPEIVAIHLAAEGDELMGTNWRGRRSRAFGPVPPKRPPATHGGEGYHQ